MKAAEFSAIVLAAGFSSRMGEFKPLLPLGNRSILERVIILFQKTGIRDIHVVIGHRQSELHPIVDKLDVHGIFNPDYRHDMFTSVVIGLGALGSGTEAVFILPVDIPLVKPSTIHSLLSAYQENRGHLLYPTFGGKRGHPPLIPFSYARDIIKWQGENGLNGALKHFESNALEIKVPDENILFDLDTPEDYQNLLKIWRTEEDMKK